MKNVSSKVKWTTSNKKIVTIKTSGKYKQNCKLTAKKAGSASVKAKVGKKTYTCKVTVKKSQANSQNAQNQSDKNDGSDNSQKTDDAAGQNASNDQTKEEVPTQHVHIYTESSKTDATCMADGQKVLVCSCGDTKVEVISALGHDWEEITIEPSCTEYGSIKRTCKVCGSSETVTTAPKGHSFGSLQEVSAVSCTKDGVYNKTCSVCGHDEIVTVKATGHALTEITQAPTCMADGKKTITCSKCDYKEETVLLAPGHSMDEGIVTKEATNDEDGIITYSCANCDYKVTDVIPATGHHYDTGEVVTAATCTTSGKMLYSCTDEGCDKVYVKSIPALGHDFSEEYTIDTPATCENAGSKSRHCTRCDEKTDVTSIPKGEHVYDEGTVTKEATCTEGGEKIYTCNLCKSSKKETIPALGHSKSSDYVIDREETCSTEGSKHKIKVTETNEER